MEIGQVIEAVCRIPVDWWRLHLSYLALLKASGYSDHAERVGQRELAAYLRANPDLIQKWLGLSDGKRVSEGWYMLPPDASFDGQHWVVGYYPVGKYFVSLDAADACAHYVKQEIEGWRAHLAHM